MVTLVYKTASSTYSQNKSIPNVYTPQKNGFDSKGPTAWGVYEEVTWSAIRQSYRSKSKTLQQQRLQ